MKFDLDSSHCYLPKCCLKADNNLNIADLQILLLSKFENYES